MYGCNRANDTSGGMLRNSSSRWGRWPAGAHNLARQTTTTTNHETSVLTYCSAYALGGNDDNYLPTTKTTQSARQSGPIKGLCSNARARGAAVSPTTSYLTGGPVVCAGARVRWVDDRVENTRRQNWRPSNGLARPSRIVENELKACARSDHNCTLHVAYWLSNMLYRLTETEQTLMDFCSQLHSNKFNKKLHSTIRMWIDRHGFGIYCKLCRKSKCTSLNVRGVRKTCLH